MKQLTLVAGLIAAVSMTACKEGSHSYKTKKQTVVKPAEKASVEETQGPTVEQLTLDFKVELERSIWNGTCEASGRFSDWTGNSKREELSFAQGEGKVQIFNAEYDEANCTGSVTRKAVDTQDYQLSIDSNNKEEAVIQLANGNAYRLHLKDNQLSVWTAERSAHGVLEPTQIGDAKDRVYERSESQSSDMNNWHRQ